MGGRPFTEDSGGKVSAFSAFMLTLTIQNPWLRQSATTTPLQPTPHELDVQQYGEAGALVVGGARAITDTASSTVDFTQDALAQAARAGDVLATTVQDLAHRTGSAVRTAAHEATEAYQTVADLAGDTAEFVGDAGGFISDNMPGLTLMVVA
jgi:ABC-type transporter Mla subunit MlaD